MTLGHSTLHYILWTMHSVWLPDRGHPRKDGRYVIVVSCRGWPVAGTAFYDVTACVCIDQVFSRHLFTCTLSRAFTPVTQFNCAATKAYTIWRWQTTSVHFSDAAWSEYGAWLHGLSHARRPCAAAGPSYLLSAICLSRRQPWNLKPLHGRRCGYFRKAQPADCMM